MDKPECWPTILPKLQNFLNNLINVTGRSSNEVIYGFRLTEPLDLLSVDDPSVDRELSPIDAKDAVALANMQAIHHYDRKHTAKFIEPGDIVNLRLYRGYVLPGVKNHKLSQQFVGPFKVIEKIG